jgi:oligopeptide/dipeptide ABC transporter ATP-binding protein
MGATPVAKPSGQAILGFSQEVTVLHPLMSSNEVGQGVWWNLFSPLWMLDHHGRLVPVLAKSIPTIENGGIAADVPNIDPTQRRRRELIRGDIPSSLAPPSGCAFRTRCPHAIAECAIAVPELRAVRRAHASACIRNDIQPQPPCAIS